MTDVERVAAGLTKADLAPFAFDAAVQWCGEKDRETDGDDIRYFMVNWWFFPGMKDRVVRLAVRAHLEGKAHD